MEASKVVIVSLVMAGWSEVLLGMVSSLCEDKETQGFLLEFRRRQRGERAMICVVVNRIEGNARFFDIFAVVA